MEHFTITKDVKHTVYYRYHYIVDADTKEEAINKFKEEDELGFDSYLIESELLWDTLEEAVDSESQPYYMIDIEEFEI